MKKTFVTLTAAAALLGATAVQAADNLPGAIYPFPTVASEQNLRAELRELGFTNIQDIDSDGEIHETIAMWDGEFVALRIDGRNGAITERYHPDVKQLNLAAGADEAAMIAALEQRGYTVTRPMGQRGDLIVYEVRRLDRTSVVMVDPRTGAYYDTVMVGQPAIRVQDNWNDAYVHAELRRLGYRDVRVDGRSGEVYVAQAMRNGAPVTLSIDMQTGVIYES